MKRGFTLAEILISLAVIAVLISIAMMTTKSTARTNALMVKKAYNTVANTVYNMVQSESLYMSGHLSDTSETSRPIGGEQPSGNTKFCKVFASFLNTVDGEVDCSDDTSVTSFTTTNGIDWYLPPKAGTNGDFMTPEPGAVDPSDSENYKENIMIDVNGRKAPNCLEGEANCTNPDRFIIQVSATGKLYLPDDITREYIRNSGSVVKQ